MNKVEMLRTLYWYMDEFLPRPSNHVARMGKDQFYILVHKRAAVMRMAELVEESDDEPVSVVDDFMRRSCYNYYACRIMKQRTMFEHYFETARDILEMIPDDHIFKEVHIELF